MTPNLGARCQNLFLKGYNTFFIALLLLFNISQVIASAEPFILGRDYVIVNQTDTHADNNNKVNVTEFFNYACGACAFLEPKLSKWLEKKPDDVSFQRIPVVFHSDWALFAKTYYIAKALDMNEKVDATIFAAIKKSSNKLNSVAAMETLFASHGATANTFSKAYRHSPAIDGQIQQGMKLMHSYGIYGVPAIVVNGHYKTDLKLANSDPDKMLKIVDFLIAKTKYDN